MYTIHCSYSRYDELCHALSQLDIDETVLIEPVGWLSHSQVLVKVGGEQRSWDIESAAPLQEHVN